MNEYRMADDFDNEYIFITDSQDIEATLTSIDMSDEIENVTGIMILLDEDGSDYEEIWVTYSRKPWGRYAEFERVA